MLGVLSVLALSLLLGVVDHGGHAKGRVGWREDRAECADAAEHRGGGVILLPYGL
jgi:hypothetical protein